MRREVAVLEKRVLSLTFGRAGIESRLLLDLTYECRYRSDGDRWVTNMSHALRFALDNIVARAEPATHVSHHRRFVRPSLLKGVRCVEVAVTSVWLRHNVDINDLLDACREAIAVYCRDNVLNVSVPPRGRNKAARIHSSRLTWQGVQHFGADLHVVDGLKLVNESNVIRVVFS